MTDEMKLLRAFIEASGYEIETIQSVPVSGWTPGVIYDMQVTYKVTKRVEISKPKRDVLSDELVIWMKNNRENS